MNQASTWGADAVSPSWSALRQSLGMTAPAQHRLLAQLEFLLLIDRLKTVVRQTWLTDRSRRENTAEHSWHVAITSLLLSEYAEPPVDIERTIRMLLVHDLVEILAGDFPLHGCVDPRIQREAEESAASRIFGLLPQDQAIALRALWNEFETAQSPEARFAKAIDRVQPLLQNLATGGGTWSESGVDLEQVLARYGAVIAPAAPALWHVLRSAVSEHFICTHSVPAPSR